jgi:hypothetical protein
VSEYGEGGEHCATEDMTTQSIRTHHTLSPYTTSHHTTPMSDEIFMSSRRGPLYKRRYGRPSTEPVLAKAVVLLPVDGMLLACGLVSVVVKGE